MGNPLCPQCQTPLSANSLAGLCPACLLEQGAFDSRLNSVGSDFIPPSIEELAPQFPALEIIELIGRGGMGAVYKARQIELDRIVALKILPAAIARDPAFSERFTREAKAMAKLNHPGIVTLYEFGRTGDLFFFLMEFVDGVTLRQLLQGERLSAREALSIVPRICDALQYAHDRGIVHRDIKPENILLDRLGNLKIADFGLAKLVGHEAEFSPGDQSGSAFTEVGKIMGTAAYMAPEQIDQPSSVDHRADIYSLGVIFYQMLTGDLPDKPLIALPDRLLIDVRLDEIVIRALQRDPTLRFQNASDLKTMVEDLSKVPAAKSRGIKFHRSLQFWGVILLLALPLSMMLPIYIYSRETSGNFAEVIFTVPSPRPKEEIASVLKRALSPFPGLKLASDPNSFRWRLSVFEAEKEKATQRIQQAADVIRDALYEVKNDPLSETFELEQMRYSRFGSRWSSDQGFIDSLRWKVLAGILLSAIGLTLISLRSAPHTRSRVPGLISLGFLVIGTDAVYLASEVGIGLQLAIATLAGVPAITIGLLSRSNRFGKIIGAIAWCALLGYFTFLMLPSSTRGFERSEYSGWTSISIPSTGGAAPQAHSAEFHERDRWNERVKAVTSWLESIDAADYSKAWLGTSTLSRKLESEAEWKAKLAAVRAPLGSVLVRKHEEAGETSLLRGAPQGRYFHCIFHTDFTAKTKAVETVTLIYQDDGTYRVLGYSIR